MKFADKVVLVTGAGSGVGRAISRGFAREGATVVAAGRRREPLEQTAALIEGEGGRAAAITADVTDSAAVAGLVGEIVTRYGRLDIAVNNAGIFAAGAVADMPEEDWARVLQVNATGVFLAMKHEIAAMRAQGSGVIVNIASNIGAHVRVPRLGAYAASKAAVSALTRTAALENIRAGVRINAVSPGPLDTTMSIRPGETEEDRAARLRDQLPIGRVGSLDEITGTVLWLASDDAGFAVGLDVVLDGGAAA
ncbi:short-chain dehydrogenase [Microbispora rosea subsp. aerata]|nr:SDR family oxidoreductase [Microbispora rosea]GGO20948.1 short-chain dehydrogenase [Microbispora rosea subsp. aerata]GIH56108.1 short-chain dehydrogenase [Microbispora rosea subsp. aerata]GLJ85673.1 short-chain dehydrogenase [Microbispora rosea subsp. aerata]